MCSSLLTVAVHDSFSFELVYFEGAYRDVILSRLSLTVCLGNLIGAWFGNYVLAQEEDFSELNLLRLRICENELDALRCEASLKFDFLRLPSAFIKPSFFIKLKRVGALIFVRSTGESKDLDRVGVSVGAVVSRFESKPIDVVLNADKVNLNPRHFA